ncbi:MAG: hypothetical protein SO253_00965 [Bacilli bacterium]|nr:hypothetical protein [Bacilli bacterium]
MICGKQLYNKIYSIIKDNKKCNYHPIKIKPISYTELKNDIQALYDNEDIKVNFGATNNLQFKIKLVSDKKYFGAFWDKELYDEYEKNTLVICANQIKTIDEYWYTLIHEVYPGHGYFFEMVKQNNTAFDTGANMLIEGYATYCEISSIESNYAVYLRQHYKMIISKLLNNKISTLSNAQKYLFNQQIGYLESYYFGAFLIEYLIDKHFKSPLKLLQFLSKNTKGEMFKLWLKDI